MIELISAAKVGKISETDVSLPEKVVSNQENARYQVEYYDLDMIMSLK